MTDLALGSPELQTLLSLIDDFYRREIELWAKTAVDAIFFQDDRGSQKNMLISPKMWREYFKPIYRDYAALIKAAGKFVFFHSDGHIQAIIPDLIEIGIDALNSQLFCMNIEQLGAQFRGQITFWGEIDRQAVLPRGAPKDVEAAVKRVRSELGTERGGVIGWCEWGNDVPGENIEASFKAWA
jgi:uroporphyrinogen decarboxylase